MKVYVIDDEPKIRRGLTQYIASCKPDWPEPGFACTAEEALADPAFPQAELLFLDIQLPGMSGLELLEQIRRKGYGMQTVIISGYAEFSFAQKALNLQVRDYLLKPIDVRKVSKILDDVENQYLQSQAERRDQDKVRQNLHSLREKYFSSVLFGLEPFDPILCREKLRELDMPDSAFILVQYTYRNLGDSQADAARSVRELLAHRLHALLPNRDNRYLIFFKTGAVAILIAPDDRLDGILTAFQEAPLNDDYLIGYSFVHPSLSELLLAYREACDPRKPMDPVLRNQPVEDQTLYVERLNAESQSFHPYVQKVMQFIAENYHTQLNLTIIATQVHLHTSYLSELFKRETGTNICNYVTDYRLCAAKRELRESRAKVASIAENVGFNDYHYFSQVFSKRVGISPRAYRLTHYEDANSPNSRG